LAVFIIWIELTWTLFVKYRETNYNFTNSVITILIAIVAFFLTWVTVYTIFVVRNSENLDDKDFHASVVMFVGLGYSLVVFIGLIMGEYSARSAS
jgi:hypothetical protein